VPVVVAINHFVTDTEAEIAGGEGLCRRAGRRGDPLQALGRGLGGHRGDGEEVVELAESGQAQFAPLYPDEMPLFEKIETVAKRSTAPSEVIADKKIATS
jgi:formate--tetrahydrofolate ligase